MINSENCYSEFERGECNREINRRRLSWPTSLHLALIPSPCRVLVRYASSCHAAVSSFLNVEAILKYGRGLISTKLCEAKPPGARRQIGVISLILAHAINPVKQLRHRLPSAFLRHYVCTSYDPLRQATRITILIKKYPTPSTSFLRRNWLAPATRYFSYTMCSKNEFT